MYLCCAQLCIMTYRLGTAGKQKTVESCRVLQAI